MDSRPDRIHPIVVVAATALSALGGWYGSGLQPVWWLAWIAPLPLLLLAVRLRARWAALATFAAVALGNLNQWHYAHEVIGLPLAAVLLHLVCLPALLVVPGVLLYRALLRQGRGLAAMWSLPAAMTGLSWLAASASPHGTFGHPAYSQMDAPIVLQIASVLGLWGVGFLLWLAPAMIAVAAGTRDTGTARWRPLAVGGAVLVAALAFGGWRLHQDTPTGALRVALVSIGGPGSMSADLDAAPGQRLLARYVEAIDRIAGASAVDVVVSPESALLLRGPAPAALQALADRHGIRLLVGVEDHREPERKRNAALVFEPQAIAPAAYFKHHLIPGFEARYTAGSARTLLAGAPSIGVAICKDLDFTATSRDYARLGTQLLLVPAWDFDVDAWLHGRMAVLRGVEGGFAVARAARDGLLSLSDDRGRVLAETSTVDTDGVVSLVATLPLRQARTPYRLWGDAFGWLCLLAALALAGVAWRSARR